MEFFEEGWFTYPMRILAIETSCDETAISVVECKGGLKAPSFKVLAHIVSSQTKIHEPFGGVVPNLARREHQKNLVPILIQALKKAQLLSKVTPWGNSKGVTLNSKPRGRSYVRKDRKSVV